MHFWILDVALLGKSNQIAARMNRSLWDDKNRFTTVIASQRIHYLSIGWIDSAMDNNHTLLLAVDCYVFFLAVFSIKKKKKNAFRLWNDDCSFIFIDEGKLKHSKCVIKTYFCCCFSFWSSELECDEIGKNFNLCDRSKMELLQLNDVIHWFRLSYFQKLLWVVLRFKAIIT